MIDIEKFIDALKISWIRREILEDKSCFKIHNSLYPFAQNLLLYGNDFIKNNLDHIRNPFWRDTYKALYTFTSSYQPMSWDDYLSTPVWFDSNIKVGRRSSFLRDWSEHGNLLYYWLFGFYP